MGYVDEIRLVGVEVEARGVACGLITLRELCPAQGGGGEGECVRDSMMRSAWKRSGSDKAVQASVTKARGC